MAARETSFWGAVWAYLFSRRWGILSFALFMLVMVLVYSLYDLPWGPAAYTALLLGVLGFGVCALGAVNYWRRLSRLERLVRCCEDGAGLHPQLQKELKELLPGEDLIERRYQALALELERQRMAQERLARDQEERSARYYTLWSHQVKTPLAAIRLLVRETPLDRSLLEQELFKTEQYVDMALQFQRLQGDDLILREIPLERPVKAAIKRTAPLFIHKKIALELGDIRARAVTDEKWLIFVLEQLLTNGVKYTGSGKVAVYQQGKDTLVVEDTGAGIRPEDLPRVFEWGFTGYNGRDENRSTGIGLYLCREVCEMLGHQISIESALGVGTKVILRISEKKLEMW